MARLEPLAGNPCIRKIMVRVTNWVGDAVMGTVEMMALRSSFPDAEIVIVANPLVAELFSDHPACDRVLIHDRKGLHRGVFGHMKMVLALRREQFDLAVLLQKAAGAALLAFLARIPRRMGFSSDGRKLLMTHTIPFDREIWAMHRVQQYRALFAAFGIDGGDGRLCLGVTPGEQGWAEGQLGGGNWLAINPGAAFGSAKRWVPERFAAVADRLCQQYGFSVVLTGGPAEIEIGLAIEQAMSHKPQNLIAKTSVRQLVAVIDRCGLMVSNDSGPMHVAAALGTPVVAIFGPTDHTKTHPWCDHYRVVRHPVDCAPCMLKVCPIDHPCMEGVTTEMVVEAACALLDVERGQ
ncbi:lipopolysaccharide heptosyltransferase II [Geopsychrobacter electrodiphilus]|uniref:lipopolysaccharide heptosyltransferase II n=1 Tax=Geopsychrobacter electrodiphilus TaxID=225196 RepID=UPI00039E97A4|nr:lipopolysaccharide heptosyltransferase II [Geopsychrobacter electrodiphilus]